MLGTAAKIEVTKENCTIVGDGSSEDSVKSRVKQIRNLVANTEQDYEKEKLNERIARLSGGVAIIQVRHPIRSMFGEGGEGAMPSACDVSASKPLCVFSTLAHSQITFAVLHVQRTELAVVPGRPKMFTPRLYSHVSQV